MTDIKSQTGEELEAQFQAWGQPAYRVTQLLEWLYVHRVTGWEAMTNLPKALREKLRAALLAAQRWNWSANRVRATRRRSSSGG